MTISLIQYTDADSNLISQPKNLECQITCLGVSSIQRVKGVRAMALASFIAMIMKRSQQ